MEHFAMKIVCSASTLLVVGALAFGCAGDEQGTEAAAGQAAAAGPIMGGGNTAAVSGGAAGGPPTAPPGGGGAAPGVTPPGGDGTPPPPPGGDGTPQPPGGQDPPPGAAGNTGDPTPPPVGGAAGQGDSQPPTTVDVIDAGGPVDANPGTTTIDPVDAGGGGTTTITPAGPGCLQAGSGDYSRNGPYTVQVRDVTIGSSGPYTLFIPQPLESNCKHPIVAWGNGTGVTGSAVYAFYQDRAASWGVVVAASHNSNVGSGTFHTAAIDYLLAENDNASSEFYGKLDTRAGTSGHSQGGMGANMGAGHPNVIAVVNVQGAFGIAPAGTAFLCLTGTADISPAGCKTSVDGAREPAMLANYEGADHMGTATLGGFVAGDPGTHQYMRLYAAWFRCFLADDDTACALFKGGDSCPVCTEPGWFEIYSRNF